MRVPYPGARNRRLWHQFGLPLVIASVVLIVPSEVLMRRGIQTYALTLDGAVLLFTGVLAYLITHSQGSLARLLRLPPLVFFGNISYMFYLSHGYVLQFYVDRVRPHLHTGEVAAVYLQFLFVLGRTTALCTVSLYLFERPVGSLRRCFVQRPTPVPERISIVATHAA